MTHHKILGVAGMALSICLLAALVARASDPNMNSWSVKLYKTQVVYFSATTPSVNIHVHNDGPCDVVIVKNGSKVYVGAGNNTSLSGTLASVSVGYPVTYACSAGKNPDDGYKPNTGTYTITNANGIDLAPTPTKASKLTSSLTEAEIYSQIGTMLEVAATVTNEGPSKVDVTFKWGSEEKEVRIEKGVTVTGTGKFTSVTVTLSNSKSSATVKYAIVKMDGTRLFATLVPWTPGASVGGTLTIGVGQTFIDLDPRVSSSMYDSYVIGEVFDSLIRFDPYTLSPTPFVAKGWEVLGDDQVRFYLNEGIKFHNGEDLTAEDVAFTFNWIVDPDNDSPNARELAWMDRVEVVDTYTVDVWTKSKYAPFAPGFTELARPIVCKAAVEEMGDDAYNLAPIGSGPYKFVEWLPGEHIKVERNKDYWLVYPNLDQVIYRPIPTLGTMMLELEAGGIDIADNMPAADVPRFQAMDTVEVLQVGSLSYFHMFFNLQSPISSDIRFRKAVYMLVEMEDAVFSIFQNLTGVKAYGCIPPALWANDQEWLKENVYLHEDDEKAQRLFAELKAEGIIPDGYTIRIHTPLDLRRRQLSTIMATSLIENGVDAMVIPLDWGPLLDLAYRSESDPVGDFEMMWMSWSGGPDPHDFAFYLFHSANATVGSADNMSWTMIPEVDQLIDEADTTLDQAVREAKYVEAQRLIFQNYSAIPGYHYVQTTAIRSHVKGFIVDPFGSLCLCDPYHNVWLQDAQSGEGGDATGNGREEGQMLYRLSSGMTGVKPLLSISSVCFDVSESVDSTRSSCVPPVPRTAPVQGQTGVTLASPIRSRRRCKPELGSRPLRRARR